ncbi:MAG: DNA double-strand break repair nuclease NurA [Candidatus Bathyarchaeota archaeon]|nr:DNA double-strand break repair nuclease NurA [Candidatus Bathyarchaeota archaeon]
MVVEELIEWVKLPQDLQHRFFELAWSEAEKLTETIQQLNLQLKDLEEKLQPYINTLPPPEKTLTVAAVDSSRSPVLSERLGVRYGVFATGVVFIKGVEKRREDYRAGVFKRKKALSPYKSRHLFNLLTTYTERKMALEALNHCDLLILDGSFYSFVYGALKMKKSGLYGDHEDRVLRETFDVTETLRKSCKVVGVIKRSHTRAIGGYFALKHENKIFTTTIDKLILSTLMPEKSVFSYHKILGENPVPVYTTIASLLTSLKHTSKDVVREAEEMVYAPFETLNLEKQGFKEMRRIQVKRYQDMPPCEVEYPSSMNENELLKMLAQENFFNEATNLPIALDLVDNTIGLTAKFTEEFVSEVEGRVLEATAKNKKVVKTFFTLLNPQKQY